MIIQIEIKSLAQAREVRELLSEHHDQANIPCCIHGRYFATCPKGCTAPDPDDQESEESQKYGMMLSKALDEFRARYDISWDQINE